MEASKTLIIIGNGIASWRVNAELEKKFIDWRIIRIGSEAFGPKCSFRTTSVNCLRGTKKGISPLGDLIVDSHNEFLSCFAKESPEGVTRGLEFQTWPVDDPQEEAKWGRRFPQAEVAEEIAGIKLVKPAKTAKSEAYFIEPRAFYQWQRRRFKRTEFLEDFVIGAEKKGRSYWLKTQKGRELVADKLFLCAGNLSGVFGPLFEKPQAKAFLDKCKSVRGTYLASSIKKLQGESFSLALGKSRLIYRSSDDVLLIGSTSENNSALSLPMKNEIRDIYGHIRSGLSNPGLLPPFERWEVVTGIRHKGAKRMPFWGELGQNFYGVFGLYKNAFSFAFLAGKEIAAMAAETAAK